MCKFLQNYEKPIQLCVGSSAKTRIILPLRQEIKERLSNILTKFQDVESSILLFLNRIQAIIAAIKIRLAYRKVNNMIIWAIAGVKAIINYIMVI